MTGSNTGPTQRLLSGQNPPVAQQEPGGIGAVWVWIAILAFGILWVLSLLKKVRNHHGR